MAFVLKDGQGTLHRNDKGGVDSRPDYRGQLKVGDATYDLAGWLKDGKNGKWLSLSAKPSERSETTRVAPGGRRDRVEDDIPW